ncbi:hypothetical protein K435DRAFT_628287, partial [Dendrothele bispora CBS 962.96]
PNRAWLPYREEFLDEMLRLEGRRGMGKICSQCKMSSPIYRCTDDDCLRAGMMCKDCFVRCHQNHPLHWAEEWNGKHFQPTSLKTLGLIVELGHNPDEPVCIFQQNADVDFTVLHTNGLHQVAVTFCACRKSLGHRNQLLRVQWYPATPKNPQSAVTFACLRQFQHLNCIGKLPAYDYYLSLEVMTKSRQRTDPPNRYRAFLRCMFQWRHLKMCKRAGRGHSIGGIIETILGELALEC